MALTPEQQARLDAARARHGLGPRVRQLPVGTIKTPTTKPAYQNLGGPLGRRLAGTGGDLGDQLKPVGRILDPAGIARGNLTDIKGGFKEGARSVVDPAGVFSEGPKKVKGKIDPVTGTVTVTNYGKQNEQLSNAYTNYLRTGNKGQLTGGSGAFKGLKRQIQDLQGSGWTYNPSAVQNVAAQMPAMRGTQMPATSKIPAWQQGVQGALANPAAAQNPMNNPQAQGGKAGMFAGLSQRMAQNMPRIPGYADGGKVVDRKPNGKKC